MIILCVEDNIGLTLHLVTNKYNESTHHVNKAFYADVKLQDLPNGSPGLGHSMPGHWLLTYKCIVAHAGVSQVHFSSHQLTHMKDGGRGMESHASFVPSWATGVVTKNAFSDPVLQIYLLLHFL